MAEPSAQPQTEVVVTQQPAVVAAAPQFRDVPVTMTNSKGQQITTTLEYKPGLMAWLIFGVLCFTLLWCCAPIPLCINVTKDVHHIDPTDGTVVGIYKRI